MQSVGTLLREWRTRRRLSQLDLACEANISTRHLSFLETGRATPSREMVIHLAEQLNVPLRERNLLLTAAGYAPVFPERSLESPALEVARSAVEMVLTGHEPFPALAIDRHWHLVASNKAVGLLLSGIDPSLLSSPINVLRITLHPLGLAKRVVNFSQWRVHILSRVRRDIELTGDPRLAELLHELLTYPSAYSTEITSPDHPIEPLSPVVPFQLWTDQGQLSFISTTAIFGTPIDVTLSELAIESFFPADAHTAQVLRSTQSGASQ
ncbi:MAG TPA: helix-turn-helix transcriptional regulator [Acidobacteriota bacterium]|nr:helix-turn-helix transcriptional regulator [Acidobacteriota bacterium]HNC45268.1 helix-turn-helix transcriptional regulator [Acidobacteriota bacterium]HNG95897.1 helix-turn-helix transcriptional regulator [Acidobacteriota bacterium]HNH82443.1 helix-turn-helix transcriptional regulator [Acidobacteriota bacterium]